MKSLFASTVLMTALLSAAQVGAAEITLGALVDGQVRQVLVTPGTQVSKGQLLLEIDARMQQARIAQLKARLRLAEAELKDARIEHEAEKTLYDQTVTAKRRYDAAVLTMDKSSARTDALRAELQEAQAMLDYYVIKAPADGKVDEVFVQVGDTVFHENQKLMRLQTP